MLSLITSKFKDEVGLYHDDGLAVCKATLKEIEKTKKEVSNVFKSNGLKITIDANKKIVHFLDVTFDLTDGNYKPKHEAQQQTIVRPTTEQPSASTAKKHSTQHQ